VRHETLAPAELELGLLLAQTRTAREANSDLIGHLARQADLARLAQGLERRRILPLLGTRLLSIVGPDHVPDEFVVQVKRSQAHARAAAIAVQAHTQEVIAALAAQGLRTLELKGPGLAERAHGDLGLRSSRDIDVLVRRGDLLAAVDLLRMMGYGAAQDPVDRHGMPHLHFSLAHATRPTVEVHWRVHWYEEAFSADLLRRATPSQDGSLVPEPVDEAAALALYFARDGFSGLRILADLTAWWERHCNTDRGGLLDDHAAAYPELVRAWQTAGLVAEQVGGLPAGGLVSEVVKPDRRMTLAVRLTSWSQRDDRDQLAANVALIDGLLTPRSMLGGFVRRLVQTERPLAHVVKVSLRWIYAFWRIRRRPWDHDLLGH
jgi:hypothetical protein